MKKISLCSLCALASGLLMGLLGSVPVADAATAPLKEMRSSYELSRGSLGLGEAVFTLVPFGAAGCYRYESRATPKGLARLFIGELRERSDFCVVDGKLKSQRFEYTRSDRAKDNFTLDFDWSKRIVRSSKGEIRDLADGMVDRLLLQLAVQRWVITRAGEPGPETFAVTKVEDRRAKTYKFQITARETLKVPAGNFETVRVERVDDPDKSTRFWLVPQRGYEAARVEQTKEGDEQLKMLLK